MITIIAEGIGFGHVRRSEVIKEMLEKKGHEVSLLTDPKLKGYVDADFIDISANLKFNENELDVTGTIIDIIKRNNVLAIKKVRDYLLKKDPEYIIVDTNVIGLIAASLTNKKILYLTNNNDFSIFAYNGILESGAKLINSFVEKTADKVLIPDFEPPFTITYDNLIINHAKKYSFIGPLTRKEKTRKTKKILLSFGKDREPYKELIELSSRFPNKKAWEVSFKEAYSSSLVLTHGGHTTIMEAIVHDLPLLFFVLEYEERLNNAKKAETLGLGKVMDMQFITKESLEFAIDEWKGKHNPLKKLADKIDIEERLLAEIESL